MTDRIRHLIVTLDRDYRDDEIQSIISAIQHVRGIAVVGRDVVTAGDRLARLAVQAEIQTELHAAIDAVFAKEDE